MKKNIILSFLIVFLSLMMLACGKTDANKINLKVDADYLEVEVGHTNILSIEVDKPEEISIVMEDDSIASCNLTDNSLSIYVSGEKIGKTKLNIIYQEEVIKSIDIDVIEEVIYLPIPTGMILLKGVDKEASVKVILTKDGLNEEDIKWSIDSDDIVSMETQGAIAHFHSLKRGKVEVTVSIGNYTNTFLIYVTNIRGDLE